MSNEAPFAFVVESFWYRDDPETVPDLASVRAAADKLTFTIPYGISVTAKFRDGSERVVKRECYARLTGDRAKAEAWVQDRIDRVKDAPPDSLRRLMGAWTANPDHTFEEQVEEFMAKDWEWLETPAEPTYEPLETTV